MNIGIILILLFLFIVLFRIPVGLALVIPSIFYILYSDLNITILSQRMFRSFFTPSLLAVPIFILVGSLLDRSGMAEDIFDFISSIIGQKNGLLAYVNIFASLIFAGMSGSAIADIGGIGRLLINRMKDKGYDSRFSAAITASSSTVGPIFPPSIPLIVFGLIAGVPIIPLFLGGVFPALLIIILLLAYVWWISDDLPKGNPTSGKIRNTFTRALPALSAPVVLIGGMLSGYFGPSEIGAIAAVYIILASAAVNLEVDLKYIFASAKESAMLTAQIAFILAGAAIFNHILIIERTPDIISNYILGLQVPEFILILLILGVLLILGMFLEPLTILVITVPIFYPIFIDLGWNPVQIGVVMVFNLMIGLLTPPFGLAILFSADIADTSVEGAISRMAPFYAILIIVLLMISFFPPFTTFFI